MSSPGSLPRYYLDSITNLLEVYRAHKLHHDLSWRRKAAEDAGSNTHDIPLVVNTMGWTKGLGADLGKQIETLVEPTVVLSLISSTELPPNNDTRPRTYFVPAYAHRTRKQLVTATDTRAINLLSYFYATFPPNDNGEALWAQRTATNWNTRLPLCAIPPLEIDTQKCISYIKLIGAGSEDVAQPEVQRVLNGALVGLVSFDNSTGAADLQHSVSGPDESWRLEACDWNPIDPMECSCVGLALIRGISPGGKRLQLLTPQIPSCARAIVKGELEMPVWGMLDHREADLSSKVAGTEMSRVPFLRWGRAGDNGAIGGDKRRIRRNILRKSQVQ